MHKNPSSGNKQAVALQYKQMETPKVTAKGYGSIADEIIALADELGILVHQDQELSALFSMFEIGQEIPEDLYNVIAELIAFSYVLQGKFPESWSNHHKKIDFWE